MTTRQKLDRKRALPWRIVLTLALVVAATCLLAANWHTVSVSLRAAFHARIGWLLFALLLIAASFFIAAFTYQVLALRSLRYRQTLLVEVAGAFVGRILPAGLGGLGLNGVYLYKRKHTPAEATTVISVNNLLGMCAHGLLLIALVVLQPHTLLQLESHYHLRVSWFWVAISVCVVLVGYIVPAIRRWALQFGRNLFVSVRRERPSKILVALLSAMTLTLTYTMLLYCTSHAIGISTGVPGIFVIFTVGMLIGTATPTPGGLVGTEAGLFAGFVAFGVSDSAAGAAVLLFRLVTYWLPIIPGVLALEIARRRRLL